MSETSKKPPNFEISYRFWQLQIRFEESESWLRFAIVDHKASILYCGIKIFWNLLSIFCGYAGPIWPLNGLSPLGNLKTNTNKIPVLVFQKLSLFDSSFLDCSIRKIATICSIPWFSTCYISKSSTRWHILLLIESFVLPKTTQKYRFHKIDMDFEIVASTLSFVHQHSNSGWNFENEDIFHPCNVVKLFILWCITIYHCTWGILCWLSNAFSLENSIEFSLLN